MQSSKPSFPSPRNGWDDLLFWLMAFVVLTVLVLSLGCGGTKVLLPQSGTLIRSGPDVSGKVYMWDGSQWVLSANKVRIPEGWFIGPLDD
jgi:hypothetical protein